MGDGEVQIGRISPGGPEFVKEVELRQRVLRTPLRLSFTDEELAAEHDQTHLGAYLDGRLVGCLVLTPQVDDTIKMRQVAVEPALQGVGIGSLLVHASERLARDQGYETMILHARESVVPFYLRLGYELDGEPFEEVTIPHRKMRKSL